MIHSELCSACGGPLQLGVGLVYLLIIIVKYNSTYCTVSVVMLYNTT